MQIQWLDRVEYYSALKTQDEKISESHETILGQEHPLTITLGKRADPLKDIKAPIQVLKDRGVVVVGVDRGGQATLHNLGQLVIYPIVNLREREIRVRDYVRLLVDVTKRFLSDMGIVAYSLNNEPGLYTHKGKIAFFGVRVQHGVTSHGLAINVNNNLNDFLMIRSCGRPDEKVSKLSDFGVTWPLNHLFVNWCNYFQTGLGLTQDLKRPMLKKPFDLRI